MLNTCPNNSRTTYERVLGTGTQSQRYRTCITQVLRENGITTPIRRARGEIVRVRVGTGAHSLSITCLSFYIIPKEFYYSLWTFHVRERSLRGILHADVVFWTDARYLRRWILHIGAPCDDRFFRRESRLCQFSRQYVLRGIDTPVEVVAAVRTPEPNLVPLLCRRFY